MKIYFKHSAVAKLEFLKRSRIGKRLLIIGFFNLKKHLNYFVVEVFVQFPLEVNPLEFFFATNLLLLIFFYKSTILLILIV